MKGLEIITEALKILEEEKSNTLFFDKDYLYFFEGNPPTKLQEESLNEIGVYFVGKYECFGIDKDVLWDQR